MAKYRALIKQVEWFEIDSDSDDKTDLEWEAAEAFDIADAYSVDTETSVESIKKMAD